MKRFTISFGCLLVGAILASSANAAIIVTAVTPAAPFAPNSGIQTVDVLLRSTVIGGEFISDISVDFDLSGGALFDTPVAGTFIGVGFLQAIDAGGSSFFDNGGGSASLSVFFNGSALPGNQIQLAQSVPDTDVLFARLNINTANLPLGTYNITSSAATVLTSPTAVFSSGTLTSATPTFVPASFEIGAAAIPEPGSFAVLALVGAGAWLKRRRTQNSAAIAA